MMSSAHTEYCNIDSLGAEARQSFTGYNGTGKHVREVLDLPGVFKGGGRTAWI